MAVRELLEGLNDRPFKKMPGSRRSLYESLDRPALKPLPKVLFEYAEIKRASVNIDYHIEYDRHFYSVPHQLRKEVVEIRATSTTIEVLFKGRRVASHPRNFIQHRHTTLNEHRPKNHQEYGEWPQIESSNWQARLVRQPLSWSTSLCSNARFPSKDTGAAWGSFVLARRLENRAWKQLAPEPSPLLGNSRDSTRAEYY